MTIKYKDLDIELDDLEGLDDDLDGFIAEAKIANELFFQDQFDFSEDSEELEELEDVLENIEKVVSGIKAINIAIINRDYEKIVHVKRVEDLSLLNVEYDDGYGSQELEGIVLFDDGTWLEREEYDGSEWWRFLATPTIEDVHNFIKE